MSGICGFINMRKTLSCDYMLNIINKMNSALYNSNEGFTYCDENCVIGKNDNYAVSNTTVVFFHGDLYNMQNLCKKNSITVENEAQLIL